MLEENILGLEGKVQTLQSIQKSCGVLGQLDLGSITTPDSRKKGTGHKGIGDKANQRGGLAVCNHQKKEDEVAFCKAGGRQGWIGCYYHEKRTKRNSMQLEASNQYQVFSMEIS